MFSYTKKGGLFFVSMNVSVNTNLVYRLVLKLNSNCSAYISFATCVVPIVTG